MAPELSETYAIGDLMGEREERRNEGGDAESSALALDDNRARAANAGDQEAASAYLTDNLSYLASMARWLAQGALDPDDLLSEATVNLLARWKQGAGPTSRPNAYVIRSMRNRIIDERKSPRSQVLSSENEDLSLPPVRDDTRRIDLYRELEYVKAGFALLPTDQQQVLQSVTVEGRKPAELVTALHRPASAIYSLQRRAKTNLKRATLRVMLSENAPKRCVDAASRLPETVAEGLDEAADSSGMLHIRACKRCRGVWARFGSMASGLGVTTLLSVAGTFESPAAANASTDRTHPSPRRRTLQIKRIPTQLLTGVSVGAIACGVVLMVIAIVPALSHISPTTDNQPFNPDSGGLSEINLKVTTQVLDSDTAKLDIDLGAAPVRALVAIRLPEGMAVQKTPAQWTCTSDGSSSECETDRSPRGSFLLSDGRERAEGDYSVSLRSLAPGLQALGEAHGQITEVAQTVDSSGS